MSHNSLPAELTRLVAQHWLGSTLSVAIFIADTSLRSPFTSEPGRSLTSHIIGTLLEAARMRLVCRIFAHEIENDGRVFALQVIQGSDFVERAKCFVHHQMGIFVKTLQINAVHAAAMTEEGIRAVKNVLESCENVIRLGVRWRSQASHRKDSLNDAMRIALSKNHRVREIVWDCEDASALELILAESYRLHRLQLAFEAANITLPMPPRFWPVLHTIRITCGASSPSNVLWAFRHDAFHMVQSLEYFAVCCGPGLRHLITLTAETIRTVIVVYQTPLKGNSIPPLQHLSNLGVHVTTATFNLRNVQPSVTSLYIYGIGDAATGKSTVPPSWLIPFMKAVDRILTRDILPSLRHILLMNCDFANFTEVLQLVVPGWWAITAMKFGVRNVRIGTRRTSS